MTGPERDLWRRWTERRDARAFEVLVALHDAFAYDFARRVTGHDADAEDLTQDAFLELAEAGAERAERVGFRAFLGRRIALGAKMLRRASLTRARLDKNARVPMHPDDAVENREAAEAALALLDDEHRQAVVLRFLHGLSYAEIAHVLGGSAGAARVRVHRALKQLRQRLGEKPAAYVAALVFFRPRAPLVTPTAQAAVSLTGGVLLMSASAKKLAAIVALVLFAGVGVVTWRASRDAPGVTERAAAQLAAHARVGPVSEQDAARGSGPEPVTPDREPIPDGKGSVAGVIRFDDGSPLAHCKLSLWGTPAVMGETDDQGRFHIHGDWVYDRVLCVRGDDESYYMGLGTARMKADEVVELDLTIQRGFMLEGIITRAGTDEPVAGAAVHFRRRDDGREQARFGLVNTDRAGRFRFEYMPKATYDVDVTSPGLEPKLVALDLGGDRTLALALKPARALIVKFEALPPAWAGATIHLMIQRMDEAAFTSSFERKIDDMGEVYVDAPPPGRYRAELIPARGAPLPRLTESKLIIREQEPPRLVFEIPAGSSVVGSVVLPDGTPYRGALLSFDEGDYETRADQSGAFSFSFVAAGANRLLLGGSGSWQLALDDLEIRASGSIRHDIQLHGTASVKGRLVTDAVSWSFHVELFRAGDKERFHARAWPEGNGEFSLPHVEAGEYRLRATARDVAPIERDIALVQGEQLDLGDLVTIAFPRVAVRLKLPVDRKLPRHIWVMADKDGTTHHGKIEFDANGEGHLTGLAPGTYELSLSPNGFKPQTVTVTIATDIDRPIVFELETAPRKLNVPVVYVLPDGVNLPNPIQVAAAGLDGTDAGIGFLMVHDGRNGSLTNLPAGKYALNIRIEGLKERILTVELTEGMTEPVRIELESSE